MDEVAPVLNDFTIAQQDIVEQMIREGLEVTIYICKPLKEMPAEPYECAHISSPTDSMQDLQVHYLDYEDGITGHSPIDRANTFKVDQNTMLFKKDSTQIQGAK